MPAFTLSGKVYNTEDVAEAISLDEMFPGREKPWFENHMGRNCTLYKSRKGQWFTVTTWVLSSFQPEAKLVTEREAETLLLNHGQAQEAERVFGTGALRAVVRGDGRLDVRVLLARHMLARPPAKVGQKVSRYYHMNIEVVCPKDIIQGVKETVCGLWDIDSEQYEEATKTLTLGGRNSLCGGKTEEEFTDEVAQTLWKSFGFLPVTVAATYLEDPPVEVHQRTTKEFHTWLYELEGDVDGD